VLRGVGEAAVLEVDAVEGLFVVAQRDVVGAAQLVVGLEQVDVLILLAVPRLGERLQQREAALRVGVGRKVVMRPPPRTTRFGRSCAAGPVGEEEVLVVEDRSAEARPVLVVMVRTLGAGVEDVDVVVLVERLVAVVIEDVAVEVVAARLGDDVESPRRPARP